MTPTDSPADLSASPRSHLRAVRDGEPGTPPPGEARRGPRWPAVAAGLVVAALVLALVMQARTVKHLEGEVARLQDELVTTRASLDAHRARLAEVRDRVGDLRSRIGALDELVSSEPVPAPVPPPH